MRWREDLDRLVDRIIGRALTEAALGGPGLQGRIKRGLSYSDRHLPDRLITALQPEERELLRGATATHFQDPPRNLF